MWGVCMDKAFGCHWTSWSASTSKESWLQLKKRRWDCYILCRLIFFLTAVALWQGKRKPGSPTRVDNGAVCRQDSAHWAGTGEPFAFIFHQHKPSPSSHNCEQTRPHTSPMPDCLKWCKRAPKVSDLCWIFQAHVQAHFSLTNFCVFLPELSIPQKIKMDLICW